MSMLHDVQAISKLSCRNQSSNQSVVLLDRLDDSFNATVCVAVSDWTFFAHDFGWDVRARFVSAVDDARFLFAL